jgi:hypothetical protein
LEVFTVPAFKYSMIFTYFSGINVAGAVPVRLGGWSESYYAPTNAPTTEAVWLNLIQARLGMCPLGTVVNKWRVQQVDPAGASILKKSAFSAGLQFLSDVPQMALKVQFLMAGNNSAIIREFRGLPDSQVTVGEYTPTNPFTGAATAFTNALVSGGWQTRRRLKSNPQFGILSVSAAGLVVMIEPFAGIAPGNKVQLLRTVNPQTGRKFGYFATVESVVDASHFQIAGPKVAISNFGTMRLQGIDYAPFAGPQLAQAEAVVRKVGRPLRSYSGRASKH